MMALAISVLLGVIAGFLLRAAGNNRNRCIAGAVAFAVSGWAVFQILLTLRGPRIPGPNDAYRLCGEQLGRAVASELPGKGRVLVIEKPDPSNGQLGLPKYLREGLRRALSGFEIVGLDLRYETSDPSADPFRAALQRCPDPVALISLQGLPAEPPDSSKWPAVPFYVLGSERDRARADWLDTGKVRVLIVPRAELRKEAREIFDAYFETLPASSTFARTDSVTVTTRSRRL